MSARRAAAQVIASQGEVQIGYQGLPYKSTGERSTGINVAEGMLLHVGAGVEAGYDSNVFYGSSSDPGGVISSGIIRVTTFGELTNATRDVVGEARPSVVYSLRAGLVYRLYTSDNVDVEKYRSAFMPSAGLGLGTTSGHWAFQLTDSFIRMEDPPYAGITGSSAGATPITRDSNLASVQAQWSPGGGRISGTLRYNNTIDVFEQDSGFSYASSLTNQLVLDVSWKWLPKTALFFQANQSWITYLNDTPSADMAADLSDGKKSSSYPLRLFIGLRGLITQKISAAISLGYINGFYSAGSTNTGIWGSTYADAQVSYSPSLLNRFTVGYHQDIVNSVISNFYYESAGYASYVQQLAGRVALDLSARLSHRIYEGLIFDPTQSRTDNTITAGATLDYFIRNWAYAGVGYSLLANLSDYHLPGVGGEGTGGAVDYTKNQVFLRLGITY
ncbi:MAG TPA: hypothetical protein VH560_16650 [Polyangia bacterium]|nr:hypothetical protein [Polyangia bacterium]